jgi:hypothetical protein
MYINGAAGCGCIHVPDDQGIYLLYNTYCSTACSRKLLRAGQSGVRFSAESRNCSFLQNVQTGSEAHPTSYPVGMRVFDQDVNRPWCKVDHLTPTILELKISGDTPPPHTPSWRAEGQPYLLNYTASRVTEI